MSAENKAIVQRLYEEVWNKRKLELVSEIISPSHALHGPNIFGSSIGPELTGASFWSSSQATPICTSPLRT